jgi:hypothetical protein
LQTEAVNIGPGTVAWIIAGVSAFTALMVWVFWRLWKSLERAERDPRYLRRLLLVLPVLYACSTVFGVFEVATGREPIQALAGLPVVVVLSWAYIRMVLKVKVPPS